MARFRGELIVARTGQRGACRNPIQEGNRERWAFYGADLLCADREYRNWNASNGSG
jgi:hypothetical protein